MSNLKEETPTPDAEHPGVVDPSTGTVETADSAGAYLRASFVRIRGGETGILPVVAGLLLVSVLFQSLNNHFLTAGVSLLAMGEVFALLLGEIDLSSGFVAGLAEEECEHLAHREQAEDGGLHQEVDEVAGGQEVVVERLEQDRDEQQASDHR